MDFKMDYKLKKENMGEIAIILAAVLSIFKNIMDSSEIFTALKGFNNIVLILFFMCIGYKMITQEYTFFRLIAIIFLGVLCAYSSLVLKYYSMFYSYLFICALQNVDLKKVIKFSMYTKAVLISLHVLLFFAAFFVKPDMINIFVRNDVSRYSFFLGHPNTFTAFLAWMLLEVIYIYYEKIKYYQLFLLWLVSLFFYIFTDSNTGTMVIAMVIILIAIARNPFFDPEKIIRLIAGYSFIIFSAIFTLLAVSYTNLSGGLKIAWENLNESLTGRLLYGAYTIKNYGVTIFGSNPEFPTKSFWEGNWMDSIYFDNSYYQFLFKFGAIYIVILSFVFIYLSKNNTVIENIFLIALFIYGIMEAYIINIFICFPLIFIGKYILSKAVKRNKKEIDMEGALWKQ